MTKYPAWFAVSVRTRREKSISRALRDRGLEVFLPRCRPRRSGSDGGRAPHALLFPGFVFCRLSHNSQVPALIAPRAAVVATAGHVPIPVPAELIEAVRMIVTSGLPSEPWQYLSAGQQDTVVSGLLTGLHGLLLRDRETFRVVVAVAPLRRAVAIQIDRSMLSAVQGGAYAPAAQL